MKEIHLLCIILGSKNVKLSCKKDKLSYFSKNKCEYNICSNFITHILINYPKCKAIPHMFVSLSFLLKIKETQNPKYQQKENKFGI